MLLFDRAPSLATAQLPVCSAKQYFYLDNPFAEIVFIYRLISVKGNISEVLLAVTLPIEDSEECRENSDYDPEEITNNMICAGVPEGGKDSCQVCRNKTKIVFVFNNI